MKEGPHLRGLSPLASMVVQWAIAIGLLYSLVVWVSDVLAR